MKFYDRHVKQYYDFLGYSYAYLLDENDERKTPLMKL